MPTPEQKTAAMARIKAQATDRRALEIVARGWAGLDEAKRNDLYGRMSERLFQGVHAFKAAGMDEMEIACMFLGVPRRGTDEAYVRAKQLIDGDPENRRCYELLAAAVQAFEDAGLHDGSHFINMAGHVWGFEGNIF
jgi:hypothetical protein